MSLGAQRPTISLPLSSLTLLLPEATHWHYVNCYRKLGGTVILGSIGGPTLLFSALPCNIMTKCPRGLLRRGDSGQVTLTGKLHPQVTLD
jgi:hypothetical protein